MDTVRTIAKQVLGIDLWRRTVAKLTIPASDALALQAIAPLHRAFLPWSGSSLRPGAVRLLLNEIVINRRSSAIEFGAGVSTVFIAKLLGRRGGQLVSIDHDSSWIEIVQRMLDEAEVPLGTVTFVHAPLRKNGIWYDDSKIEAHLGSERFDLGLVDGPVSSRQTDEVRRPAGPLLSRYMKSDFAIFLDDIARKGERQVAASWVQEFGWSRTDRYADAGVSVFRPPGSNAYNIY